MNPITHALTGWVLAETFAPESSRREKQLITAAAVVPDLDGLGIVAELTTEHLWYSEYHHVLAHNLAFAVIAGVIARVITNAKTAALVFVAVHLHLLGDVAGSRGPDEHQWPIPYLYPFSRTVQWTWDGQWYLNAWPNFVITIALLVMTFVWARTRGYSIVGLFSPAADREFVSTLRRY